MPAASTPQTGGAYGPDFPNITIRDIVAAQKALLDHLGVRHLVAVAGPSYGGYQAFQWAVAYPDFINAIVPVNTAPWASVNTDKQLAELQARLASGPEWHGGRYYGKAACKTVLTDIRVETLKRYGIETALAPRFPNPAAREAAIRDQAAIGAARNGNHQPRGDWWWARLRPPVFPFLEDEPKPPRPLSRPPVCRPPADLVPAWQARSLALPCCRPWQP
jgi:homoserine acetyltransferase